MINSKNFDVKNHGDFYHDEISRPASTDSRAASSTSDTRSGYINKKRLLDSKKEGVENKQKGNLKPFIQFLISYVGLLFGVILYVAGGAYLFQILEQHSAVQKCQIGEGEWENLKTTYR